MGSLAAEKKTTGGRHATARSRKKRERATRALVFFLPATRCPNSRCFSLLARRLTIAVVPGGPSSAVCPRTVPELGQRWNHPFCSHRRHVRVRHEPALFVVPYRVRTHTRRRGRRPRGRHLLVDSDRVAFIPINARAAAVVERALPSEHEAGPCTTVHLLLFSWRLIAKLSSAFVCALLGVSCACFYTSSYRQRTAIFSCTHCISRWINDAAPRCV